MRIRGIDFTSTPGRSKSIVALDAHLIDGVLSTDKLTRWKTLEEFEAALIEPGPWIAGLDLPFGQSRRFIETIGWPSDWAGYVDHVSTMTRKQFRQQLDDYRASRPAGDKEHRRATDRAAGSISPQKLYGVPVGLMFFEGAPRLRRSGAYIPGLQYGDSQRIAVEAYPGVLARKLIQRRSYKNDARSKQTEALLQARSDMLQAVCSEQIAADYGFAVVADPALAEDPTGDAIDALLCAVQAAWAWTLRASNYGAPVEPDNREGWIADPQLLNGERC